MEALNQVVKAVAEARKPELGLKRKKLPRGIPRGIVAEARKPELGLKLVGLADLPGPGESQRPENPNWD